MSSHNIDEPSMLRYVSSCYMAWGVTYMTKEILKKAQANAGEASPTLRHLLFDVCILAMVDYEFTIEQLGIQYREDDPDFKEFSSEFILSFLSEIQCPYIISSHAKTVGLDMRSSRSLLLVVGWLMAITDFFGKIRTKLIQRSYAELSSQPQQRRKQGSKKQHGSRPVLDQSMTVEQKFKVLKQLEYKAECFEAKKIKIIKKLEKQLLIYNKTNQTNIKIDSLLKTGQPDEQFLQQKMEKTHLLMGILQEGIKGMKYQHYFWMWMQLKVCDGQVKYLQQEFEDQFEWIQVEGTKVRGMRPNPDYLKMYLTQYQKIEQMVSQMEQNFEEIEPYLDTKKVRNSQQIEKEIRADIKNLMTASAEDEEALGHPCFLPIELNKYLEEHGFSKKKPKKAKKEQKPRKPVVEASEQSLREQITEFIEKLDGIKFM